MSRRRPVLLLLGLVVPAHTTGSWFHDAEHPVHSLFRRQAPSPGAIGSPEWRAVFPVGAPDPANVPQAWKIALATAVTKGLIPTVPLSTETREQNPVYPPGPAVCSSTYKCRHPGDHWDAPDGYVGISFDDGPLPSSGKLYDFLDEKNISATHFIIGTNAMANPRELQRLVATEGAALAVHTWTHPYMTALTNLQIIGQLGWTIELIYNVTEGKLPRYWRPPYGDSDNRVRAVAKAVFGLETVIWNQDTEDWSLTTGGTTPQVVHSSMEQWLSGPKSPGLIILEHELSVLSVQAFIDAFPLIKSNGWKMAPVTSLLGQRDAYQDTSLPAFRDPAPSGGKEAVKETAPAPSAEKTLATSASTSASVGVLPARVSTKTLPSEFKASTVEDPNAKNSHPLSSSTASPVVLSTTTVHVGSSSESTAASGSSPVPTVAPPSSSKAVGVLEIEGSSLKLMPLAAVPLPSTLVPDAVTAAKAVAENQPGSALAPVSTGVVETVPYAVNEKKVGDGLGLGLDDPSQSMFDVASTLNPPPPTGPAGVEDGMWHPDQYGGVWGVNRDLGTTPLYPSSPDFDDGFYDDAGVVTEPEEESVLHTDPGTGTLIPEAPVSPPKVLPPKALDGVSPKPKVVRELEAGDRGTVEERRWSVLVGRSGVVVVPSS